MNGSILRGGGLPARWAKLGDAAVSRAFLVLVALTFCSPVVSGEPGPAQSAVEAPVRPDFCPGDMDEQLRDPSVDYMGFFPTMEGAIEVAASLDESIFEITIREAVIGPGWVVTAKYRELPNADEFEQQKNAIAALAKAHGSPIMAPVCMAVPRGIVNMQPLRSPRRSTQ